MRGGGTSRWGGSTLGGVPWVPPVPKNSTDEYYCHCLHHVMVAALKLLLEIIVNSKILPFPLRGIIVTTVRFRLPLQPHPFLLLLKTMEKGPEQDVGR